MFTVRLEQETAKKMRPSIRSLPKSISLFRRLLRARAGNATLLMAFGAPALIATAGFAVDTAQWYLWKREMQYAADQAALSAAYSKSKGISTTAYETHAVQEYNANLQLVTFSDTPTVALAAYNGGSNNSVVVRASATRELAFSGIVLGKPTTVSVSAQATYTAGATYTSCIIATNATADGAITVGGSAILKSGCGIAALSNSTNAIKVDGSPTIDVNYVLAAGGIDDWFNTNTDDVVKEYVTSLADPFASLTPPTNNTAATPYRCVRSGGVTQATLNPGTYTDITTSCNTVMNSGIYVINGGSFTIRAQDAVTANGVMIVLKNGATIKINGGAALNLTAMTSSQLASAGVSATDAQKLEGILFFEDRNSSGGTSTLNGNSSSVINGTVYLPKSLIKFGGTAKTTSRCLQITANMVAVQGNTVMTNFCPAGLTTDTVVSSEGPKVILVS